MTLPGFSAACSLYQGVGRYRPPERSLPGRAVAPDPSVVPAYFPGPVSSGKCQAMIKGCLEKSAALCAVTVPFFPPSIVGCAIEGFGCAGIALRPGSDCCPQVCDFDPFNQPGGGCCDEGETCVDQGDPNSRSGCCPAGQSVCGGKCCGPGEKCCGASCCPGAANCCGDECGCQGGSICQDGVCTFPSFGGGGNPPPPDAISIPRPPTGCPEGWKECLNATQCCAPGIKCCGSGCSPSCVN